MNAKTFRLCFTGIAFNTFVFLERRILVDGYIMVLFEIGIKEEQRGSRRIEHSNDSVTRAFIRLV